MLPHGGVDMTFGELQEISVRQQRELDAQQKMLLTKEQRLKFLRTQDAQHLQIAAENERLRKLREQVESQELKLKKLRALRGQAEQQKINNGNLSAELDSIKVLFSEKEKELNIAVAKVDHLTQQLEQFRVVRLNSNAKVNSDNPNVMAALELEKLKKKLALRNKLNEQQNVKMTHQRDILLKRRNEANLMDKRIAELQQRLKKRLAQQIQNSKQNEQNRANRLNHVRQGSNIAAVEPYHHAPRQTSSIDETYSDQSFTKDSPKYQSLPGNAKIPPNGSSVHEQDKINSLPQGKSEIDTDYKIPLVVSVDKYSGFNSALDPSQATFKSKQTNQAPPPSNGEAVFGFPSSTQNRSAVGIANFVPKPFGGTYSTSMLSGRGPSTYPSPAMPEEVRQDGSGQSSPATSENSNSVMTPHQQQQHLQQQQQQHPASPSMHPGKISTSHASNSSGNYTSVSSVNMKVTPENGPMATVKSITSQLSDSVGQKSGQKLVKTSSVGPFLNAYNKAQVQVPPSDVLDHRSNGSLPQKEHIENSFDQLDHGTNNSTAGTEKHTTSGGGIQSHPTNPTLSKSRYTSGSVENPYMNRLGSDTRDVYHRQIAAIYNPAEPVSGDSHHGSIPDITHRQQQQQPKGHERSTVQETERSSVVTGFQPKSKHLTTPPGVNPQHRDIDKGSFKVHTPKNLRRRHSDSEEDLSRFMRLSGDQSRSVSTSSISHVSQYPTDASGYTLINGNRQRQNRPHQYYENSEYNPNGVPSIDPYNKDGRYSNSGFVGEGPKRSPTTKLPGKSLLKHLGSKNHSRRVTFDPLALLLDASLEGELGLVMKTAHEVANVSASNDEGITALHNAICAGHYDIVKFLVEFGCDVNAPDSDGWTPLHCAASCDNLPMVQLLVNHGACIFATTISDHETAAEKCEEDEDGYDGCSEYLYSVQEKFGIINNGIVYTIFDYEAENTDEISFKMGNQLTILRKGDDNEKEWWWARHQDQEGYVARNLLGLQPRVSPEHSRWLNS